MFQKVTRRRLIGIPTANIFGMQASPDDYAVAWSGFVFIIKEFSAPTENYWRMPYLTELGALDLLEV